MSLLCFGFRFAFGLGALPDSEFVTANCTSAFQNLKITLWTLNYAFQGLIIYIYIRKFTLNTASGFPFGFPNFELHSMPLHILCSDLFAFTSYAIWREADVRRAIQLSKPDGPDDDLEPGWGGGSSSRG